ncbi:MAG: diguanylate cyclase [Armatimonadota bacterium]
MHNNKLYSRILILLRWAIFIYILSELLKTPGKDTVKLINISNEVILVLFFLFYAAASFITLNYRKRTAYYGLIAADLIFSALLFLSYSTGPNTYPNNTLALVLCLPILEAAFISLRAAFLITFISGFLYLACQEFFKIALFEKMPHYFQTSDFGFVIVFLFVSYLAAYLFDTARKKEKLSHSLLKILEMSQILSSKKSRPEVFSSILKTIKKLFLCHTVVIYLLEADPEGEPYLKAVEVSSPAGQNFIDFDPLKTESVLSTVFKEKHGYIIDDFIKLNQGDFLPKNKIIRSILISPLIYNDNTTGLIVVAHNTKKYFTGEDYNTLNLLAREIATNMQDSASGAVIKTAREAESLEGIYSHAYFHEHLKKTFQICKNADKTLALLLINVDYFKKVNALFGHNEGDSLLKQLGSVIKNAARKEDVVCRYDADEFAIIMPQVTKAETATLSEKIRQAVTEHCFLVGGKPVHITVSGGTAVFPDKVSTEEELVEKARSALTMAKGGGRNKILFIE